MDSESREMVRLLTEWIAQGPGVNSVALAAALEIVAALARNAPWGAPKARLIYVRELLRRWFSPECSVAEPRSICQQQLFDSLWMVETWWERSPEPGSTDRSMAIGHS